MASLTLRTLARPGDRTKNAPLTNAEVDTNFINLDADIDLRAPIDSPTFTGVPTAPTPLAGDNSAQLATTKFVASALSPVNTDLALKAPIESPVFTGVPAAPTAVAGTNTTQLATTKFVTSAISPVITSVGAMGVIVTSLSNAIDTTGDTVTFDSTGAIVVPAGTDAQRPATPAEGALRYNTTTNTFEGYSNGAWGAIGGGATGGVGNAMFWENDQTITADYTITVGKNAGTFGPVTVADGVTVTVPGGASWTIV